jgi:hypothetical protein
LAARTFSDPTALPRALILSLGAGLIWQFALVLIVVRREQGSLSWPVLKKALWLNAPFSPRTGKRSNRLWWMIIPLMVLLALEEFLPALPTPARPRRRSVLRIRHRAVVHGGQLGLVLHPGRPVRLQHLSGEELFFRGLLLPRMAVFGRADWVANGVLFGFYHLHEPWVIPQTILVDTFAETLPSRRWRSSLIGIAVHSGQTVFLIVIALALVLR